MFDLTDLIFDLGIFNSEIKLYKNDELKMNEMMNFFKKMKNKI
jgi:hypothetical protein